MEFPLAEAKFSQIARLSARIACEVRYYRVDDGGIDPVTQQPLYARALHEETTLDFPPDATDAQLVETTRAALHAWALVELGVDLPPDRLICDL